MADQPYSIFDQPIGLDSHMNKPVSLLSFNPPITTEDVGAVAVTVPSTVRAESVTAGEVPQITFVAKQSFSDTSVGMRAGIDIDGEYKWIIGGPSSSVDWNVTTADTLTVVGGITATTGTIGGFTIGATTLSATSGGNTTTLSSGSTAFSAGPTGSPTVTITQAGVLTAADAVINGSSISNYDIFGFGDDGNVTISANTTLARDMFYDQLTVDSGFNLITAGYRVFCKTSCTVNGTIHNNGASGLNGAAGAGGNGGAGGIQGTGSAAGAILIGGIDGQAGANGGNGGAGAANGSNSGATNAGTAITAGGVVGAGVVGKIGGNGGNAGAQTGGSGAVAGGGGAYVAAVSSPQAIPMTVDFGYTPYTGTFVPFISASGNGGGGGGGGGAGAAGGDTGGGGGGAGGGGQNGGNVLVMARTITIGASGAIKAVGGNGGNGGNGAAGAGANAGGGGGGGGGMGGNGGIVCIAYSTLSNSGSISAAGGSGGSAGTGGAGLGTGANGTNGTAGTTGNTGLVVQLQV